MTARQTTHLGASAAAACYVSRGGDQGNTQAFQSWPTMKLKVAWTGQFSATRPSGNADTSAHRPGAYRTYKKSAATPRLTYPYFAVFLVNKITIYLQNRQNMFSSSRIFSSIF
jgi:hypothetical protein